MTMRFTSVLSLMPFSFLAKTFTLNSDPEGRFSILNWRGGIVKKIQNVKKSIDQVMLRQIC